MKLMLENWRRFMKEQSKKKRRPVETPHPEEVAAELSNPKEIAADKWEQSEKELNSGDSVLGPGGRWYRHRKYGETAGGDEPPLGGPKPLKAGASPLESDSFAVPRTAPQQRIRDNIQLVIKTAENWRIDPARLAAIAWNESRYRPGATGPYDKHGDRDIGLMQLRTSTIADYADDRNQKSYIDHLRWPEPNVDLLHTIGASEESVRANVKLAAQVYRGTWNYFENAHKKFLDEGGPLLRRRKDGSYINPINGASPLPPSDFIVTAAYNGGQVGVRRAINSNPSTWTSRVGDAYQYTTNVQKIIDSGMFKKFIEEYAVDIGEYENLRYEQP